ncbi:MAG: alpha-2-macroglobulin family protein [Kiritimatiellia bacterium]
MDEWADYEVSALALLSWANELREENKLIEARQIAQRGTNAHPKSCGGAQCYNLVQQIEAKQVRISTERVWNEPWPVIAVNYQNLTHAFFRAVPYDFNDFISRQQYGYGGILNGVNGQEMNKFIADLIARKPVAEWNATLPATTNYHMRMETVAVPKDLKPGFYVILASHDASFGKEDNQVSAAVIWVSELALVVRQRHNDGIIDGFVLQAQSGQPIAGATVLSWTHNNDGKRVTGPETKTDANGMFRLASEPNRSLLLLAQKDEQRVSSDSELYSYRADPPRPSQHTIFFMDRALYRPGQIIQYKGICHRVDTEKNEYATLAGQTLTVIFRDPNGREVGKQQHKCNDYGAFSGSFTAPGGTVSGQMTLQVQSGPDGYASFRVEEYKRPKFQVELSRPKEAAKLGAEVAVPGKATSYTGAAIGGAKVQWRVVRNIQFPYWCWWSRWYLPPGRGDSQNIAHGTTTSGADGAFTITFAALPDLDVSEKTEPTFTYTVYADVTDTTGETRSDSQSVRAGYTALSATISADEWQTHDKPVVWTIGTTTLDGEPQAAKGTLKVYALQQPEKVARASYFHDPSDPSDQTDRTDRLRSAEPKVDPANADSWASGEVVAEHEFKTDATGSVKLETPLKAGIYRTMLETKDRFGKTVTARQTLQVMNLKAAQFPVRIASRFIAPKWSVEPGESFLALWGTGYDAGQAYVELEHRGKVLRSFWTGADKRQEVIEQSVTEDMRGGFTIRITYVRENRAYLENRVIDVPWSNKKLTIKWEHFTSKLEPGKKETWTAVVSEGKDGRTEERKNGTSNLPAFQSSNPPSARPSALHAVAEMVATLYDASLDQYQPHQWMQAFSVFRQENSYVSAQFENSIATFQNLLYGWKLDYRSVDAWTYRHYPADISQNIWLYGMHQPRMLRMSKMKLAVDIGGEMDKTPMAYAATIARQDRAPASPQESKRKAAESEGDAIGALGERFADKPGLGTGGASKKASASPDLSQVAARKNLNETAFFFPQLVSDAEGVVRMEFTMPEALTEWKFMGFAHDRNLRSGYLQDKAVTAKEIMVEPNPPRFVREGDAIEFTVKVSNQSAARQSGKVRLTFADARTLKDVSKDLGLRTQDLGFDIPAKESKSFAWRIAIPDGCEFLTYKAVGATDRLSDGEEGYLPVLSQRIPVIESLPLPIRGKQTKTFEFTKLLQSGKSKTLKHENLTVQMVSQPAWYAVMALPYLMEYPYECSEQTFNRLYANTLARHIANIDPKIRRIFDQWKNTPALDSPMEKNQELKSVMLEETPWLREAKDESQSRRNVGILFDANRLDDETKRAFDKLAQMQLGDGLWPWFPGCRGDEYITLYITTGFGRMRHLGAKNVDMTPAMRSLNGLDAWMDRIYREILRNGHKEDNHLSPTIAFYLYGRSFFLKDKPIAREHQEALDYWLGQGKQYWLKLDWRQPQGHLAIALKRFGDQQTPLDIMKSIKEHSVSNEEMGLFWRDTELSWWWYRAPIETQALMIEAFDEVMGDAQTVEDCKVWLLKQKQTQDWKTTKATADAVYGLLLRGTNLLASDALVEVSLGGEVIKPEKVEAGTGFYEQKFVRDEIKPAMGKIEVKKTDEGVSWGSVHWQYLEDMTKITPYEGTPLKVKKTLYRKETTKKGQVLEPVKGALAVGDELVCRIELRVDRDMEYVHLKDQRGSGTEPVNVLSQAKYQDGLMYYESTRDTASHFFIHYLPKGVYVFEYSVRVQLKGNYQSGIATVQCMYAPEFNSHSESFAIEVK